MRKIKSQKVIPSNQKDSIVKYKIRDVELNSLIVNMEDKNLNFRSSDLIFEIKGFYEIKKELSFLEFHIDARTFTDNKKNKLIASIHTITTFEIVNMRNFTSSENIPKFPELFLRDCFSISYSTTRGIFLSKCAETRLGKLILPLLDPLKQAQE